MARKTPHKVFVYGILKTPEHRADPPAAVPGRLFMRGIALGKFEPEADTVIRGEILTVDDSILRHWDWIEGVDRRRPSRGLYRRIRVTTTDGDRCWAYHYNGSVDGAAALPEGLWLDRGVGR